MELNKKHRQVITDDIEPTIKKLPMILLFTN